MKPGCIHIGTSGWHYKHWVGPFYPKDMRSSEYLTFYSRHFPTVEINTTFYHLPSRETLTDWCNSTPNRFVLACKASRFITHMKKLKDPEQSIRNFFDAVQVLGRKLGPILFQLPPRWKMNLERLENFLKALPKQYRFAFEFRDESWLRRGTYDLLAKHHAACCLYHFGGRWSAGEITTDFVYIRLHGPNGPYQGQYDDQTLRSLRKKFLSWSSQGKNIFCYFDNDEKGFAAQDGARLLNLIKNTKEP